MLQLLLLFVFFRVFWWVTSYAVSLVGGTLAISLISLAALFGKHSENPAPPSPMPQVAPVAETSASVASAPVESCSQKLVKFDLNGIDRSELCTMYYRGNECADDIKAMFDSAYLLVSPQDQCGTKIITPNPNENASRMKSLMQYRIATDKSARSINIGKLFNAFDTSEITYQQASTVGMENVFLDAAEPTGEALSKFEINGDASGLELLSQATISPFKGIVRGVYEYADGEGCEKRKRDHSLCIDRDDSIKCDISGPEVQNKHEQICVDYLIR